MPSTLECVNSISQNTQMHLIQKNRLKKIMVSFYVYFSIKKYKIISSQSLSYDNECLLY